MNNFRRPILIAMASFTSVLAACSSEEKTPKADKVEKAEISSREITQEERSRYMVQGLALGMTLTEAKSVLQHSYPTAEITENMGEAIDGREFVSSISSTAGPDWLELWFSGPGSGSKLYLIQRTLHAETDPGFVSSELRATLQDKFRTPSWTDPENTAVANLHWGAAIQESGERDKKCPQNLRLMDVPDYLTKYAACGLNAEAEFGTGEYSSQVNLTVADWGLASQLREIDRAYDQRQTAEAEAERRRSAQDAPSF